MSKAEYEVVKKLEEAGYMATVRLGNEGFLMKIKRRLPTANGKHDQESPSIEIEQKPFGIAQKFGYHFKEIGAEEYEKGVNSRVVPYIFFVKQYPFEE